MPKRLRAEETDQRFLIDEVRLDPNVRIYVEMLREVSRLKVDWGILQLRASSTTITETERSAFLKKMSSITDRKNAVMRHISNEGTYVHALVAYKHLAAMQTNVDELLCKFL